MSAKVNLWFVRETQAARLYCRHGRPGREDADCVWVPKSIVEHTSKNVGGHHVVTLPEWFVREKEL